MFLQAYNLFLARFISGLFLPQLFSNYHLSLAINHSSHSASTVAAIMIIAKQAQLAIYLTHNHNSFIYAAAIVMSQNILIVDDDTELCQLLEQYLSNEGITVSLIHDGLEAVEHLQQMDSQNKAYDAIVLDSMLPGMQGLDILQRLRGFSATPVLMLTARGDDIDRIVGLEAGADDYLPKPCNPRELLARLRAVLRRTEQRTPSQRSSSQSIHGITLDSGNRNASINDKTLCFNVR